MLIKGHCKSLFILMIAVISALAFLEYADLSANLKSRHRTPEKLQSVEETAVEEYILNTDLVFESDTNSSDANDEGLFIEEEASFVEALQPDVGDLSEIVSDDRDQVSPEESVFPHEDANLFQLEDQGNSSQAALDEGNTDTNVISTDDLNQVTLVDTNSTDNVVAYEQGVGNNEAGPAAPGLVSPESAIMAQSDPALVGHLRKSWIVPPQSLPRKLLEPTKDHYPHQAQSEFIDSLLSHRTHGFFVEVGAGEGELLSDTLFFEVSRNWTGLLIEPKPIMYQSLYAKSRQAFTINACVSPDIRLRVLDLSTGRYLDSEEKMFVQAEVSTSTSEVQCFPLWSMLLALNITHVDFLSLDVGGFEYEILQTLPLDQMDIDAMAIEYVIPGDTEASNAKYARITELLVGKYGYRTVEYPSNDVILIKTHIM